MGTFFSVILEHHMILLFCCFMIFRLSKENKPLIGYRGFDYILLLVLHLNGFLDYCFIFLVLES